MIKVRDVVFFEDVLGHDKFRLQGPLPLDRNILCEIPTETGDIDDNDVSEDVNPDEDHLETLHASWSRLLDANSEASFQAYVVMLALTRDDPPAPTSMYLNFQIPRSYHAVMASPQAELWKYACDNELKALTSINTWDLVPRTPNMTVIKNK